MRGHGDRDTTRSFPGCAAAFPTSIASAAGRAPREHGFSDAGGAIRSGAQGHAPGHRAPLGPGDVTGIQAQQVIRTEPRAGVTDFEPNYLAAIDFYDEDFPWRYTPPPPDASTHRLAPWILLVVLRTRSSRAAAPDRPLSSFVLTPAARRPDIFPVAGSGVGVGPRPPERRARRLTGLAGSRAARRRAWSRILNRLQPPAVPA